MILLNKKQCVSCSKCRTFYQALAKTGRKIPTFLIHDADNYVLDLNISSEMKWHQTDLSCKNRKTNKEAFHSKAYSRYLHVTPFNSIRFKNYMAMTIYYPLWDPLWGKCACSLLTRNLCSKWCEYKLSGSRSVRGAAVGNTWLFWTH